jgi:hypothetical protein
LFQKNSHSLIVIETASACSAKMGVPFIERRMISARRYWATIIRLIRDHPT